MIYSGHSGRILMHIPEPIFKKLLLESKIITEEQFNFAKEEAERTDRKLENVLIGRGDVPEKFLAELLGQHFDVPAVDLKSVTIPTGTLNLIPENTAKEREVVLFEIDKEKRFAKVAMIDPGDLKTIEFLKNKLGVEIKPYVTTPSSLGFALQHYELQLSGEFSKTIEESVERARGEGELDLTKMAKEVQVINLVSRLIDNAIALNASDIHFEPRTNDLLIRYRVEGVLREILKIPKIVNPLIVARVKIMANLQIDEHRVPQDGRVRHEAQDQAVDIRVAIMPTMHGEKVEMRLLKESSRPISLQELGFLPENLKTMDEEIKKTQGMILTTGPTGSGKTTTLYAILHILNQPAVNIVTVEDPIEYDIQGINQTQINVKAGVTFATGLRALVRQDPDIIMVGEIRDEETVNIAINSALTGHLVLSTIHTNDAPTTIPRLLDMGAEPFLIASTLNVAMGQRLVRKICQTCIESYEVPKELKNLIKGQLPPNSGSTIPERLFQGRGCNACNLSGYRGLIAIFEILRSTEAIKKLIVERAIASKIKEKATEEGMKTMFEDGLLKAEAGITTIDEVLRVIRG